MPSLNVAIEDNHRNMKSCCLPVNKKGESLKKLGQLCARAGSLLFACKSARLVLMLSHKRNDRNFFLQK